MNNNSNSLDSTKTYPYCYRIKEGCPPCVKKIRHSGSKCIKILAKLMSERVFYSEELKKEYNDELFKCLMRYGDIYKQLNIELYVNPKTKLIVFPDMQRIQSNFNLYLRSVNTKNPTFEERDEMDDKLMLYDILLHEKLKEKYDEFYYSYGFSDIDSLQPKEYGIARILGKENESSGSENESSGGKKIKKSKTKKNSKHKISKKKRNRKQKNKTFK